MSRCLTISIRASRSFAAKTLEPSYAVKQAVWKADADTATSDSSASVSSRQSPINWLKRAVVKAARSALIPDAQVLWQPGATLALRRRLADVGDDVVWITGPPFSSFMLAPLAHGSGAAVVLDYRDEWKTLRETYEMSSPLVARAGAALERRLLGFADAITTATPAFRDALLAEHAFLDPNRVFVVPNGFDPDDYPDDLATPPEDEFVITYAGTVLTVTSPGPFLDAVRTVSERRPELATRMRIRFIGRIVATEEHHFKDAEALGVERHGYMDKAELAHELGASHINLCLLSDHPDCARIYPGKIFELMHLGRPTLTVAPPGALTELIAEHEVGAVFKPSEAQAIAEHLIDCLEAFVRGEYQSTQVCRGIERFHRRATAGQIADVLRFAVHARAKRSSD